MRKNLAKSERGDKRKRERFQNQKSSEETHELDTEFEARQKHNNI
jgi:hypothetical protein